jgi:hypothetical protein
VSISEGIRPARGLSPVRRIRERFDKPLDWVNDLTGASGPPQRHVVSLDILKSLCIAHQSTDVILRLRRHPATSRLCWQPIERSMSAPRRCGSTAASARPGHRWQPFPSTMSRHHRRHRVFARSGSHDHRQTITICDRLTEIPVKKNTATAGIATARLTVSTNCRSQFRPQFHSLPRQHISASIHPTYTLQSPADNSLNPALNRRTKPACSQPGQHWSAGIARPAAPPTPARTPAGLAPSQHNTHWPDSATDTDQNIAQPQHDLAIGRPIPCRDHSPGERFPAPDEISPHRAKTPNTTKSRPAPSTHAGPPPGPTQESAGRTAQ